MNREDTLDLLLENPKSFCRYGDGEFSLIAGRSIVFQDYDEKLAQRLREILGNAQDKCYVGIDDGYFKSTSNLPELSKNFGRANGYHMRSMMLKYCNKRKLYISSPFTIFYMNTNCLNEELQRHFDKDKELFRGRKLLIFSGNTVFDNIKYNVFEYAAERKHIFTVSKNAWQHYEEIMNLARQVPKDVTICFILGPAATVLAYDLAQEGYMAWDIGHIAKDYDAFMKKTERTRDNVWDFFQPD